MNGVSMGRRAVRWLPVLLCMTLIFYLSAQPDLPHHAEAVTDVIIKKSGHMVEYGILAGLTLWALRGDGHSTLRYPFWWALAIAGLYAVSDEMHQYFVPGRNPRPMDVGFDLLGACLALAVIAKLGRAGKTPPAR
jgi:VanZ family protein